MSHLCKKLYIYSKVYPVLDTQVGKSKLSWHFERLNFSCSEVLSFLLYELLTNGYSSDSNSSWKIHLCWIYIFLLLLQEVHLVVSVCKTETGRCLHFLSSFFFSSHLSCANLRVMSVEAYCRENVYSSISSVERFSVEGCTLCLPACRGGAPSLVLGLQLFVFLIGFFCEEQKSRGTHADVVCNQSRKQASEFILGDAHGDSDSVAWHFRVSPLSQEHLKLTWDKRGGEIAYGTPSFKLGSFWNHDGGVKYVIFEHLALFLFFLQVIYCHSHKHSKKWGFKYFTKVLGSRYYLLSRQHVNGLLSLALSAPPVLPLGGLIAFLLEVVKYSLMYVNEIHS